MGKLNRIISFEAAKLLKDSDITIDSEFAYDVNGVVYDPAAPCSLKEYCCEAPRVWQVLDWFDEKGVAILDLEVYYARDTKFPADTFKNIINAI